METSQALQLPVEPDARIARALDRVRGLMIASEVPKAYAVQRRFAAILNRRALIVATSGRVLIVFRGLLGGAQMKDIRWQDLTAVHIHEGTFGTTLTLTATPSTAVVKAVATGSPTTWTIPGLRKELAQQVYVLCQTQEQAWREKNRVRELEEMRAKAGGVQLPAAGGSAGSGDATARLQQAKDMLDKGLITDAEYEALKAKVFAGL